MEPSSPSGNLPELPQPRWSNIIGTAIAVLTLALPPLIIVYYSSSPNVNTSPLTTSPPTKTEGKYVRSLD